MFDSATTKLLHEKLPRLPHIVVENTLKYDLADLLSSALSTTRVAVIDDARTSSALGDQVFRTIAGKSGALHITLEGFPRADEDTVRYVQSKTVACNALVAVGAGSINDICKRASLLDSKPYIVFPTAASMNGYLSSSASIEANGYRKSFPAHMPQAVFCDLSIISAAPVRMSKSGLGDSVARPTAQADWLLSHLLLNTPYDDTPFALLKLPEAELFDCARGIALQDKQSVKALMRVLLLSGLGMTIANGSYPASQGEHMIAHTHAMMRRSGPETLHGEEIGVTTLIMARMQEAILRSQPQLRPNDFNREAIGSIFGEKTAEEAARVFASKQKAILNAGEDKDWDSVAERLEKIVMPASHLQSILERAEAPIVPETLGWTPESTQNATRYARYLRDRFTFLDIG